MGIRDLFSGSGRGKSRLDKWIRTATNAYAQAGDRGAAMHALLKDGSEEAVVGLLRRFTVNAAKSIEDEEEKGWVYRKVLALGEHALGPCKTFCLEYDNIAWALRIIEEIADEDQEWDILDALLEQHPPGYERDPSKKIQLLTHVAEIDADKVTPILVGYLDDADEGVRYLCAEQLIDIADERAREPLITRLCDPKEESLRLKTKILDGLASLGWDVADYADAIAKNLGNEHALSSGKIVRR